MTRTRIWATSRARRWPSWATASQGHAHAQNLRDSGVEVVVSELPGNANYQLACDQRLQALNATEATAQADLIVMTLPDEAQPYVYKNFIAQALKAGQDHGLHPRVQHPLRADRPAGRRGRDQDRPKGPGHLLRSEYVKGGGVPCLIAVEKDYSGNARKMGLAWGAGIGGARPASWRPPSRSRPRPTVRRAGGAVAAA